MINLMKICYLDKNLFLKNNLYKKLINKIIIQGVKILSLIDKKQIIIENKIHF